MTYDLATVTPPRATSFTTYTPEPADEKMIRDALAFLVVKAPFFAHLLYNEMLIAYTRDVPWAATDGRTIFLNVDGMKASKWTLANIAFVIAHEISHGFLGDLFLAVRFRADGKVITIDGPLDYYHELMNIAEDYRINPMLVEAKCGRMPTEGLYDKDISEKGFESAVEIYAKLFKNAKKIQASGYGTGRGAQGPGSGFDVHLEPGPKEQKSDPSRREQAIAAAVAAAEASGQGTIPSAIRRLLGEILDPKVSWQDHLRSTCIRKGGDPLYDWRYMDRRLLAQPDPIYFARQAHSGAGVVVIAGDTSGSITDPMVQVFFGEMGGIVADLNPSELHVLWCDAHVHRTDTLEEPEDLLELHMAINKDGGPGGGGGTSFVPVFQWIEEQGLQPDLVVYFTDTYGTFPDHEPNYPVVWASIVPKPTVPWGEVVEVEL